MTVRPAHWAALLCLVALWGSSYLMIELALAAWQPAEIAGLRIAAAAAVLLLTMLLRGNRLPWTWRHWRLFAAIAVIGNCLPFFLISWGQQYVESGLAGILAAATPLFVLILAHFVLDDERLNTGYVAAFGLGFCGIVVLMGPDSVAALGGSMQRLLGQAAILAGALGYAVATVIARKLPAGSALVTSAGVMLVGSLIMAPYLDAGLRAPAPDWRAGAAIGFLGIMGTGIASILYFRLVAETGARFTSMLNYLVPIWAVGLGAAVLGELLPWTAWLGLILVLGSLILVSKSAIMPTEIRKKRS